ncbi:hypothetical protein LCGC14_2239910 [marine sediment metagenome]|uniref:Uncharacterized protein n=1 Tax=marine sediment metagenome TaxID=412755 RepID=A0A0F9D5Y5_9ZZZZ
MCKNGLIYERINSRNLCTFLPLFNLELSCFVDRKREDTIYEDNLNPSQIRKMVHKFLKIDPKNNRFVIEFTEKKVV